MNYIGLSFYLTKTFSKNISNKYVLFILYSVIDEWRGLLL